eukprot:TRINITY_DN65239_c0_g1_i1.p1 TRINITY_DN65239_c0_g1~~TRINITY_DN65239_c0_g1_i1.p1  ORF type:complete len:301 (-),score=58.85 TRINITY_DN65239_c0_g1_i1:48-923(-)
MAAATFCSAQPLMPARPSQAAWCSPAAGSSSAVPPVLPVQRRAPAAACFAVLSAAALTQQQRLRSCRRADGSASDRLLYDSLSREVGKLNKGKRRKADVQRSRSPARNNGGYSANFARATRSRNSSSAPAAARLLGALCFAAPLVAAVPYGAQLFAHSALLREVLLKPLFPLIRVFHSSRYANMLSIIGIYALARNPSVHPFTRAVGLQASTLMMMQFPANFLLQFFGATPGPIANISRASIFGYFMYCVFVGLLGCLRGEPGNLPGIGRGIGGFPSFRRQGPMTSFRGGG